MRDTLCNLLRPCQLKYWMVFGIFLRPLEASKNIILKKYLNHYNVTKT